MQTVPLQAFGIRRLRTTANADPERFLCFFIDPQLLCVRKSEHAFAAEEIQRCFRSSRLSHSGFDVIAVVTRFVADHDDRQLTRFRGLLVFCDDGRDGATHVFVPGRIDRNFIDGRFDQFNVIRRARRVFVNVAAVAGNNCQQHIV